MFQAVNDLRTMIFKTSPELVDMPQGMTVLKVNLVEKETEQIFPDMTNASPLLSSPVCSHNVSMSLSSFDLLDTPSRFLKLV